MRTTVKAAFALSLTSVAFASSVALAAAANPPSKSPLFGSKTPVRLELSGDFKKIKDANADGEWQGEDHDDAQFWTDGIVRDLSQPTITYKVKSRTRGMSNLTEAEFPKLRVEIDDAATIKGGLFEGSRNFRINTHASVNPKAELNEAMVNREALAYDLARDLYLETPAYRRAIIDYVNAPGASPAKNLAAKPALILETDKKMAERLQAKEVTVEYMQTEYKVRMSPVIAAVHHLFQIMIGNADANLRFASESGMPTEKYRPIFNTLAFSRADGSEFPLVYDLNKATMILNRSYQNPTAALELGINDPDVADSAAWISTLRARLSPAELARAVKFVQSRKEILYKTVNSDTYVDAAGRKRALAHLDKFFAALDVFMNFQVIAQENVHFYKDANAKTEKLPENTFDSDGSAFPLYLGTPVKILGKEKNMLKVAILNMKYQLSDGESLVGYVKADTKIADSIPTNLIGNLDSREFAW